MHATDAAIIRSIIRAVDAGATFKESDHPRAKSGAHGGEFVKGSGGGSTSHSESGRKSKHHLVAAPKDRASWPAYVKKLKIPPAWTDVKINPDPNGDLLATGRDAKGRIQPRYSERFKKSKAAEKFKRIQVLERKFDQIVKENEEAATKSKDPVRRDCALLTKLIMETGLRPGSEKDTGADKQAYGATTLQGKHVRVAGKQLILDFTGKKGVDLKIPVDNPELIKLLKDRAKAVGSQGKLFPHADGMALLKYVHTLDGGKFKTKDLRTRVGTTTAAELVEQNKTPPTNLKEYKKAVKEVAAKVAERLGNTPTIALQSYISPVVFAAWRESAGV